MTPIMWFIKRPLILIWNSPWFALTSSVLVLIAIYFIHATGLKISPVYLYHHLFSSYTRQQDLVQDAAAHPARHFTVLTSFSSSNLGRFREIYTRFMEYVFWICQEFLSLDEINSSNPNVLGYDHVATAHRPTSPTMALVTWLLGSLISHNVIRVRVKWLMWPLALLYLFENFTSIILTKTMGTIICLFWICILFLVQNYEGTCA